MKVDEFLSNRDPGDETKEPEFEHVTSLTPSGIECLYSWAPKRLYRLRQAVVSPDLGQSANDLTDWIDVPSVTTALGVLDKSGALSWWSQGIAAEGVCEMVRRGVVGMAYDTETEFLVTNEGDGSEIANGTNLVRLLTEQKLSINHVTSKAADRGTNVHSALEAWCVDENYRPNRDLYEEHEQGYIDGLNQFLADIGFAAEDVQAEVMVGSLQHGFAGRYDLRLTLTEPVEFVTKTYPKRADKRETVDAGTYLLDLKSSKDCYASHSIQLAAYELASQECGYGSSDFRAVVRVTSDGRYEFRRAYATAEDFLSILAAYNTMKHGDWF